MTETPKKRSPAAIAACLAALAAFTVADLGTKAWAEHSLSRDRATPAPPACQPDEQGRTYVQRVRTEPLVLIEGYLEFRYAENCGAAFGMMDNAPKWLRVSIFMSAGVVAIGAMLWMFVMGSGGPLFATSVPLVVSGALGNMVDRLRLGYVIDFIRFHTYETWEWPTFNVADATISVGVALLLLDGLRRSDAKKQTDTAKAADSTAT